MFTDMLYIVAQCLPGIDKLVQPESRKNGKKDFDWIVSGRVSCRCVWFGGNNIRVISHLTGCTMRPGSVCRAALQAAILGLILFNLFHWKGEHSRLWHMEYYAIHTYTLLIIRGCSIYIGTWMYRPRRCLSVRVNFWNHHHHHYLRRPTITSGDVLIFVIIGCIVWLVPCTRRFGCFDWKDIFQQTSRMKWNYY